MTTADEWARTQMILGEEERAHLEVQRLGLRRAIGLWLAAASAGWLTVVCVVWLVTQAF